MKHTLLYATIISALGLSHAQAAQINGQVLNENKQPVSGASIHIHGKDKAVYSDENGHFTLNIDAQGQLHISKDDYIDQRIAIDETQNTLVVELLKSSIETVTVYASGLHKTNMDMASPVTVLSGDTLKNRSQATLGETLKGLPGVNSTYFGPVSSSPIIRGLDGPRVKILQNGLDSSDASRIGADHATTNESLTAQQIEVLRGPATLLYGSGAIGGVVNIVDQRIPTDQLDEFQGAGEIRYDTVSEGKTAAINLATGKNGFNVNLNALRRKSEDYKIPSMHVDEHHDDHEETQGGEHDSHEESHEIVDKIENTFIDSTIFDFGASYVAEHLTVGVSYGNINTEYGIPGHEHGHEEHAHEGHEDEEHNEGEEAEHNVYALLEQDRWQALAVYTPHNDIVEKVEAKLGYTQYQHAEIEGGIIGTIFKNDTNEARISVEHTLGQWHGVAGYHFYRSDYEALGDEAFSPSSKTSQNALFVLQERKVGDITIELGARYEQFKLDAADIELEHGHDTHSDHEEHGEQEHHEESSYNETFDNLSLSAGLVWNFAPGYSSSFNVTHSERAPSSAELLSNGLHISTGTYDLGLGYEIEDGEIHFEPEDIKQETANNFDLTFRKFSGDFGFTVNLYYNQVDNFYFQQATEYAFDSHDHELVHINEADEDAAAVYQYASQDATLYGLEYDLHYAISPDVVLKVFGDHSQVQFDDDSYLPRLPANKLGSAVNWNIQDIKLTASVTHYFEQDKIAFNESVTDSYSLIDLGADYQFNINKVDANLYVNINNLTDELAFSHSSFIKDIAPLPGRNIALGIRAYF